MNEGIAFANFGGDFGVVRNIPAVFEAYKNSLVFARKVVLLRWIVKEKAAAINCSGFLAYSFCSISFISALGGSYCFVAVVLSFLLEK